MPETTPRWKLRYPVFGDPVNTHADIERLASTVETAITTVRDLAQAAKDSADSAFALARTARDRTMARALLNSSTVVASGDGGVGALSLPGTQFNDRANMRRLSTDPTRVFAVVDGLHRATGRAVWEGQTQPQGRRKAIIRKNFVDTATREDLTPQYDLAANIARTIIDLDSGLFYMRAGEHVELFVGHNQGIGINMLSGMGGCHLTLEYIRPLP